MMPITSVADKAQRRLKVEARSALMMGITNERQLKFNSIKDAKQLLESIKRDLRNKADLDTMSMDDLYNNLKVYELEVKGMSSLNSNTQNMAFMSFTISSTNRAVNTANGVFTANTQVNAAFSTNIDNLSDAVICAFMASQPNSPQLAHEDLEQIHPDDIEEMDLRWQMAMLTMRARRVINQKKNCLCTHSLHIFKFQLKDEFDVNPAVKNKSSEEETKGNPQIDLQDKGVIDIGCSRHMTGNMAYLTDYKEIDEGYVAFGRNPKGRKITGKCTIKTANKDETSGILKSLTTRIENLVDHKVKVIRCDNRTEFKNREMNQFCEMKGILRHISVARTPQQNGVTERRNRTLIEAARTILADFKLPTTFWAEAVDTACYVQNRVLVVKPHNKTPYELFHGRTPTLSFIRPFGCPVTILNTEVYLDKFNGKDDEGFFVGYSLNSKAFRVLNSRARIVEENLHIRFSEHTPNVVGSGPDWLFDIDALTRKMNYEPIIAGTQFNDYAGTKASDNADPKSSQDDGFKPSSDDGKKVDEDTSKGNEYMSALEYVSTFDFSNKDEDDEEMDDMNNLDTTIQEQKDEEGTVIRNKARLVAQGHTQEEGIDYDEVFTHVARIEAIRLFLAYASFKDFMVYQMDVKSDFLYGKIEEEVYLYQPLGFKDPDFPNRVYKAQGDILLVLVYVDDIIFGSTRKELCNAFEKLMHEKFQMSSMEELTFFLKFGFTEVKTVSTSMETQKPLLKDEDGEKVDVHMHRLVH
nr:retrotransposon protein, putative, unclassified [Tanacetum cinerariifolium]